MIIKPETDSQGSNSIHSTNRRQVSLVLNLPWIFKVLQSRKTDAVRPIESPTESPESDLVVIVVLMERV